MQHNTRMLLNFNPVIICAFVDWVRQIDATHQLRFYRENAFTRFEGYFL